MGFDFRKHVPTQWKHKLPNENEYKPEVHDLHNRKYLEEEVAKGNLPQSVLVEHYEKFKDTDEDRERRWRREAIIKELNEENIKLFQESKENPKSFLKRMEKIGRYVSKWWFRKPPKSIGRGRLVQRIDGSWQQEYKPDSSKRIGKWLQDAEQGQVFKNSRKFNGQFLAKYKRPTDEIMYRSHEAKKERKNILWNKMLELTNNFGRGFEDPRRGRPGYGVNQIRPTVNNPNPKRQPNSPRGGDADWEVNPKDTSGKLK